MTVGGSDLSYPMGKAINAYDQPMDVRVKGGFADMFLRYNPDFNTISVLQVELGPDYVGTYKIDVIGTYDKPNGE